MSITDKMKSIRSVLRLDQHHAIQRFGVIFAALAVTGAVGFSSAGVSAATAGHEELVTRAVYADSFVTSKTAAGGDVVGVFTSSDRKRAMVLMKFDDVSQVSTDASNYQAFMTGTNQNLSQKTPKGSPEGSILMFGATGYMGIQLENPEGFEPQILNITVRANSEIIPLAESEDVDEEMANGDGSFKNYDQLRLFVNPGASEATHLKALDQDDPQVQSIYNEMIIEPQEEELRGTMQTQLETMQSDLAAIDEYKRRLQTTKVDGLSLEIPEDPAQIKGDSITCEGVPLRGKTGDKAQCPSGELGLKTDKDFADGYNIDWRDGSVDEGYLDEIVPADRGNLEYLSEHSERDDEAMRTDALEWKMDDGSYLDDLGGADTEPVVNLNSTISLLTGAYKTYYDDKQAYQVDSMTELLNLELSLLDVESNHTVNDTDDSVLVY